MPEETKEQAKEGETTLIEYKGDQKKRWQDMITLLSRPSAKYAPPNFNPDEEDYFDWLREDRRILVVGAGGLGCEILKNLALTGFKDIEVIDLDIIELSNLNRQFLFRKTDIDKAKSRSAANFIAKRCPDVKIKWYQKPLQEFSLDFYAKFDCVIAGLDNVEARRWLNATLYDIVDLDENGQINPDTIIPFIDGGTEAFSGQVRLFVPRITSCFECSVGTITPPKAFQSCTIASIPRRPEHCIAYAHKILWNRLVSLKTADDYKMVGLKEKDKNGNLIPDPCGVTLDKDDVEHMSWIFRRAEERAKEFNIEGVTFNKTMQVVKNIIPAIASTNALVSAACVNECLKSLTWCSYGLNNYMMFMGQDGVYSRTWEYKKNEQCPVCGTEPLQYKLDPKKTLFKDLYHKLLRDEFLKLKAPAVSNGNKTLFLAGKLRKLYAENIFKPIGELIEDGDILSITDKRVLGNGAAKLKIIFEDEAYYIIPKDDGFPLDDDFWQQKKEDNKKKN